MAKSSSNLLGIANSSNKQGTMNKKLWSGITTAALTTVLGTTLPLIGSSDQTIASNTEGTTETVEQSSETNFSNPQNTKNQDNQEPKTITLLKPESEIATIATHRWKGKLAVTLRVRSIPILTFLDSPLKNNQKNSSVEAHSASEDPVKVAQQVADRLNQLHKDNLDADKINVIWDEETKSYIIQVADEPLVSLNDTIILPDTTNNRSRDALQATNRLRRTMGNAQPLQKIVTQPLSQPSVNSVGIATFIPYKRGIASWYGPGFHGRRTANGERYNQHGLTAAHRYLPFGTRVRVTNLRNGSSVVVRINDRGPYAHGRIIDLSAGAAKTIGLVWSGVAPVALEVLRN